MMRRRQQQHRHCKLCEARIDTVDEAFEHLEKHHYADFNSLLDYCLQKGDMKHVWDLLQ